MVTVGGKFIKTYLKICIHILGSGTVERAFRAIQGFHKRHGRPLSRPLRAELVPRQTQNPPRANRGKLQTIQDVIAAEELIPKKKAATKQKDLPFLGGRWCGGRRALPESWRAAG